MDLSKYFFSALLFVALPVMLYAQNDSIKSYRFNEIVITATRSESYLKELASSITIIDSAEITNRRKSSILELLKDEYGLNFTQQGGPGKLASIYLRGANTNHTLILIDGVEMNMPNDPSNTYDFSYITPDNVNRIEILRGPQSTLYGSDAVAGVINIITRKGSGSPSFSLSGEGGAYDTYKGTAGVNGSLSLLNYSLTLSRFITKGFSSASEKYGNVERDGSDFYNFSSRVGAQLSKNIELNLFSRLSKGQSDYDQFGGKYGDDPTYIFEFEESAHRIEGGISLLNNTWKQTVGVSFMRNIRKYNFDSTLFNPYSSRSLYDGRKIKADWQNNFQLTGWNTVTFGVEAERELSSSEYIAGDFVSRFDEHFANTAGVFVQDKFKIEDSFFGTVGIRYDKHNKFGSIVTYRIAPAYLFKSTGTKLKFTYGNAFKTPSLFYLFDPAFGNVDLKPEKNTGWDAGVEQYFLAGGLIAGINYFSNSFTDLFGFDQNFKTVNINKAETAGIELYSTAHISNDIMLKFNYTYMKASEISPLNEKLPLIRRPDIKISFMVSADITENLNIVTEVLYIGQRYDRDFSTFPANTIELPSYMLTNLSASYRVLRYLDIYGRVDNLFDEDYEEIIGYATPRLSFYGGCRVSF